MWHRRRGVGGVGVVQQHDCSLLLLQLLLQSWSGAEIQDSLHISQVVAAFLFVSVSIDVLSVERWRNLSLGH